MLARHLGGQWRPWSNFPIQTIVREMKEKCLIMGDRYMSLLRVLILFAF
jgi:hypothetical protein